MQGRQHWKYAILTLCLCLAGAAHADEIWHVTSGANGEEHSIWSVTRDGGGNPIVNSAEIRELDGSIKTLPVFNGAGQARVMGMQSHSFCQFEFEYEKMTTKTASGTELCTGKGDVMHWTATIDAQK